MKGSRTCRANRQKLEGWNWIESAKGQEGANEKSSRDEQTKEAGSIQGMCKIIESNNITDRSTKELREQIVGM